MRYSLIIECSSFIELSSGSGSETKEVDSANTDNDNSNTTAVKSSPSQIYFQLISISSIDIKLDLCATASAPGTPSTTGLGLNFQALQSGDYLQLLNLFPLQGVMLTLRHVKFHGVAGVNNLLDKLVFAYAQDIYHHQLHRIISGMKLDRVYFDVSGYPRDLCLGTLPLKGLSNIGSSLQDLLIIPINEYKRQQQQHKLTNRSNKSNSSSHSHSHSTSSKANDVSKKYNRFRRGQLMHELKNKSGSFLQTMTRETLDAASKLTMFVAKGISDLASDEPTVRSKTNYIKDKKANQSSNPVSTRVLRQPNNLKEGMSRAYDTIQREMSAACESIIAIPIREYHRTGGSSTAVIKSVVRAIPVAVLRPIAGAVEGMSYTLLGLRNVIDPDAKIEEEDIWNVENV